MNEAEFWRIVEMTNHVCDGDGDGQKQANLLIDYLSTLSVEEVIDFETIFNRLHRAAYECNLWEAAIIIEGLCSDDGFTDFRAGLIGRGRAIYEVALLDPESLLDVVEAGEYISAESLNYVADQAYEKKTGIEFIPLDMRVRIEPYPTLKGEWSSLEELPTKYPKLYAKFTPYWENVYGKRKSK